MRNFTLMVIKMLPLSDIYHIILLSREYMHAFYGKSWIKYIVHIGREYGKINRYVIVYGSCKIK